ncbi:MAG: hypothetical protein HRF49_02195 [bacterium]|jgi:hypothetical protein
MKLSNLAFAVLIICLLLPLLSCPKRPGEFVGKDYEMMKGAKRISRLIDEYFRDVAEYPESLEQVKQYLLPNEKWPENPYTKKPIADTGSRNFDPAASVGMVYYERIFRDEQQVNYNLHVFGDRGKLYIIGNTAFGQKE